MKILLLLSLTIFAKTEHRHHKAHSHGQAKASIAFEEANGKVEFESPAESIIGFEHVAKNPKDKAAQLEAILKLEHKMNEMIVLDPELGCTFKNAKVEVKQQGAHAEVQATYDVTCKNPPNGSKVTFNFQNVFPKIKTVDVQILAGAIQKSLKVKKSGDVEELK